MSSSLRKSEQPSRLSDERGSALMIVLIFAAIAMITVSSYLLHQMSYAKPVLRSPSSLQALFNARSGVYRAFYKLIDSIAVDTLPAISTLDSMFGASMFDSAFDSALPSDQTPQFDGTPVIYDLFPGDSLGECEIALEPVGGYCLLRAIGRFRSIEQRVTAAIGSRPPALPDTIVICRNTLPWKETPAFGTVVTLSDSIPQVNTSWFNSIIDRYCTDITDADTLLFNPPLLIQSTSDLEKIDSVVNGPLLIDGAHIGITWRDTGTILVKGDLQLTGEVLIEGVDFTVAGEIKILDKATLINSNLFTQSRLFIGDVARFEGNALALRSIAVYGKAEVVGKSTLIAGSDRSTSGKSGVADSLRFSLLLSEASAIDAVCIALGTPGSIKTDQETKITGILWAQHLVCHRGTMAGLICTGRMVDCDDPLQMVTASDKQESSDADSGAVKNSSGLVKTVLYNSMPGDCEPLQEIGLYHLPFFIGRLSIVAWTEE
ncbi:MAG: hypothetical protein JXA18_16020 [Chitinispirillaceae bacterium]|nr:hypothetical protein [Chitinispirillaceae bacterium]